MKFFRTKKRNVLIKKSSSSSTHRRTNNKTAMQYFPGFLGTINIRNKNDLEVLLNEVPTYRDYLRLAIAIDSIFVYQNHNEEAAARAIEFLELNGLTIVASIMATYRHESLLQDMCCTLVSNVLAVLNEMPNVSSTGITEAIISAMESYPDELGIQKAGCLALACIALNLNEVPLVCKNGGVGVMMRNANMFPDVEIIQVNVMSFISNISFDMSSQHDMCVLGIPSVVHQCMRENMDSGIILERATSALSNITYMNPTSQITLLRQGAVDTLLKAMEVATDEITIGYCARSLSFMYSTEEALNKYFRPDVIDRLKDVERRYPTLTKVRHSRLSIERVSDPVVARCVERGVCVNTMFPICSNTCMSADGSYCPMCCIQQKSYTCTQCDGEFSEIVYCESCWNKYHKGHKGRCYFFSSRCRNRYN